ncbi:NAD-dependent glucose-6-phosphate dehydrogenase Azf [Salinibaculum salinum]|uniref:NAD-dependent glucose-6-phosphate dehydrogenase Azf n=1 Tax=Salinibaculum salinum TaxID=3131996 RepID=UPI0030EEA25D
MNDPVLLTGAGGHVGQVILDGLRDEYDWRLMFHSEPAKEPDFPYWTGEVQDYDDVAPAAEGVGAIIHLAGDPRPSAPWKSVLQNNIDGTHTVYEVAVDEGVEKVVYASSNHAVGAFESDERTPEMYRTHDEFRLDGTELPRPGNKYGISKATGEIIGRYYHDKYDLSVCNVRIGNLNENHPPIDYERGQAMWLSPRDCAHIHQCTLEADYGYEIVYGISDNDRKYYSLERAKEVLGYEPMDNSAEWSGEEKVVKEQ